jgi:hypothetical protein
MQTLLGLRGLEQEFLDSLVHPYNFFILIWNINLNPQKLLSKLNVQSGIEELGSPPHDAAPMGIRGNGELGAPPHDAAPVGIRGNGIGNP